MRSGNSDLFRVVALAACLSFPACITEEVELSEALHMEVHAEIKSSSTVTKADDVHANDYDKSSFAENDEISIYLSSSPSDKRTYKKLSGDQWIPAAGVTALEASDGQTFIATYPTEFTGILADQTTATNFWGSNQLKAEATAVHNKVNFTFAPAFAKVTITIIYSDANVATEATISATGIQTGGNATETIELFKNSADESNNKFGFIGIIHPGASGKYTISIKYSDSSSSPTGTQSIELQISDLPEVAGKHNFLAGHNYNYTFTSSTNLILNNVTVTSFGEPTSGGDMSAT